MYETEQDEYADAHRGGPSILYLGLWLLWVILNLIAFAVGERAGQAVESILAPPGETTTRLLSIEGRVNVTGWNGYLAAAVGGLVAGAVLGLGQGLLLAPYLKLRGLLEWIGATIIGRAVRWVALFVIGQQLFFLVADKHLVGVCFLLLLLIGVGCVAGGALGYAQSVVLRRRVRHSNWWVLANIPGPVMVAILIVMGLYIEDQNVFRDWASPIMALITSSTTGIALIDMLRHPTLQAEWQSGLRWRRERKVETASETVLGSTHYSRPQREVPKE